MGWAFSYGRGTPARSQLSLYVPLSLSLARSLSLALSLSFALSPLSCSDSPSDAVSLRAWSRRRGRERWMRFKFTGTDHARIDCKVSVDCLQVDVRMGLT